FRCRRAARSDTARTRRRLSAGARHERRFRLAGRLPSTTRAFASALPAVPVVTRCDRDDGAGPTGAVDTRIAARFPLGRSARKAQAAQSVKAQKLTVKNRY